VSKSTVINRELGNPNDFHMVRRPNEGRKPIFAFLDDAAAAAGGENTDEGRQPTPPPPVQKISLVAKPLEKYEQKLLADLRNETAAAEAAAIASYRRRKDMSPPLMETSSGKAAEVEPPPRVKKSGKKKATKATAAAVAGVEDMRADAETEERWRRALAEEEAAAARGPKGRVP
jgi:hypothetical protein